ncbi:hypothetical protein [Alicyclobacillus pomorum]|jgi:hypothetical protein|uniref:hypothetical protein n=1 Tax=Alicyclobacillus pomorum TaxID=204470 RepID=UPI0004140522|nr:hypothetical protein [Alicyclobacillus pomorum]
MLHFTRAPDAFAERVLAEQKRRQSRDCPAPPSKAQVDALREYIRQFGLARR